MTSRYCATPTSCQNTSVEVLVRTFSITLRLRSKAYLGFSSGPMRETTRPVMPWRRLATASRPTPRRCSAPTTESPKTVYARRSLTKNCVKRRKVTLGFEAGSVGCDADDVLDREMCDGPVHQV